MSLRANTPLAHGQILDTFELRPFVRISPLVGHLE